MELRHLRYLVAVAKEQSFNSAADVLHVTQPALSRAIRDLEDEVGTPLFTRTGRGVAVTAAGLRLVEYANSILEDVRNARIEVGRLARGETGTLRIGVIEIALNCVHVHQLLRRFVSTHPDLNVSIVNVLSADQTEGIRRQTLDMVFLAAAEKTPAPDLEWMQIESCRVAVAVPDSHPLASRSSVALADLQEEKFVWSARIRATPMHARLVAACARHGFTPRVTHETSEPYMLTHLIGLGLGVGFVHSSLGNWPIPHIKILPLDGLDLDWPVFMAWRKGNPSPVVRALVDLAGEMQKES